MLELSFVQTLLLLAAIALVAMLYSSVGHGGATGYLAVMSLLGVAPVLARPGALWMNVVVAGVAFWRFQHAGCFNFKVFLPLAIASVPLAWVGSRCRLEDWTYSLLLGLALLAAGWLLGWGRRAAEAEHTRPVAPGLALAVGGALGFLAGMSGIGGGVYLTPLLIFLHWTPAKVAAGVSALFIVVNSLAGLAGLGRAALIWEPALSIAPVVGVGAAFLGTHLAVRRWNTITFRRVLAMVLWIAAGKNLLKALG